MQAGEFTRQIQPESMARKIFSHYPAIKPLENMVSRTARDGVPGVADQHNRRPPFGPHLDSDTAVGPVVFSGIFQQILQDESGESLFPLDTEIARKISFKDEAEWIWQCVEIVQPSFDQLT